MSNWIDAHAHLTDPRLEAELPRYLTEAFDAGITGYVLGGVDPDEWERQKRFARRYPGVAYLAFGVHPWTVAREPSAERTAAALARLHAEVSVPKPACRAIGETGLDFHSRFGAETHAVQARVFREHLRLALATRLPLVLHVVRAHDRALEVLREERRDALSAGRFAEYSGIVHSFSDEPKVARAYLELGFYPSISAPVITREKGAAFEKLRRTMVTLSATEFVIETDSPDQPPAGETGINRPANLFRIAEAVARIRTSAFPGTSPTTILDQSTANVRKLFGIESL